MNARIKRKLLAARCWAVGCPTLGLAETLKDFSAVTSTTKGAVLNGVDSDVTTMAVAHGLE